MLTIRWFKPGDGDAVSRIIFESFRTFLHERCTQPTPPDHYEQNAFVHTDAGDRRTFVAEENGQVIGCLHFLTNEGKGEGDLWIIGVDPNAHSRGIGSALFAAAEDFWREKNIHTVKTCVSHINPKAIAFYHKHGFYQTGIVKDEYFQGVDELHLEKKMDAPEQPVLSES